MVRKTSWYRVGNRFDSFTNNLLREINKDNSRKVSKREFTDNLADFIINEDLDKIMLKRFKRKGGGLF